MHKDTCCYFKNRLPLFRSCQNPLKSLDAFHEILEVELKDNKPIKKAHIGSTRKAQYVL